MRRRMKKWRKKLSSLTLDNITTNLAGNENGDPDNNQADIPVDEDTMKNIPGGSRFAAEELRRRNEQEERLRKKHPIAHGQAEQVPKPVPVDEAPPEADGPKPEGGSSNGNRHISRKPLAVLDDDNSSSEGVRDSKTGTDESSIRTGLKSNLLRSSNNSSVAGTISENRPPEKNSSEQTGETVENHAGANGPWNDATSITPTKRDLRLVLVWIAMVLFACWLFEVSNGMLCALVSEVGDWSLVAFCVSAASLTIQAPFVILSTIGVLPMEWTDLSSAPVSLSSVFLQASGLDGAPFWFR